MKIQTGQLNEKAGTLIESLNWIRQFKDKTIVVCLGSNALDSEAVRNEALVDIHFMETIGARPVVVHGGGKQLQSVLAEAGDLTGDESTAIIEKLVAVEINELLAAEFEAIGGRAMTLNFDSTPVLTGEPGSITDDNTLAGGIVTDVDRLVIENLCYAGQVPFIPAMCLTNDNARLLVDEVAASAVIAGEMNALKLVLMLDSLEVLGRHVEDGMPSSFTANEIEKVLAHDSLPNGQFRMLDQCIDAIRHGVEKVHLVTANLGHGLMLELFTDVGIGIEITEPK